MCYCRQKYEYKSNTRIVTIDITIHIEDTSFGQRLYPHACWISR